MSSNIIHNTATEKIKTPVQKGDCAIPKGIQWYLDSFVAVYTTFILLFTKSRVVYILRNIFAGEFTFIASKYNYQNAYALYPPSERFPGLR